MRHANTSRAILSVAALAMCLGAAVAQAAAPLPGTYQSTDLGGSVLTGRYTEGWDAGGGAMNAGTTQNCQSWNGSALGTQWKYTCGTQASDAVLVLDAVDGFGNGNRTWKVTYTGGTFWLAGTGPWANGDAAYPGHFDAYAEYETVQYVGGVAVAAVTNLQTTAHFDAYPVTCVAFSIANGSRVGTTANGDVLPPNWPALLDASCGATRTQGAWWNMTSVTLSLQNGCVTGANRSTWGALKSLYR